METLQAIGWAMILNSIVHYFLMRNKGYEKFKRNMIVYAILTFVIIASSYPIWLGVDNYLVNGRGFSVWPNEFVANDYPTIGVYILTVLTGDLEPMFPFLATSFAGSMIGLCLAKPKVPKKLPRYLGFVTLGFFVLGGVFIPIGEVTGDPRLVFDFTWFRPNLPYFFILMGVWIGMVGLFLRLVEFRGKGEKFATSNVGKYFRRWGIIALTIYSLQIFALLPRWLLSFLLPSDQNLLIYLFPKYSEGYVLLVAMFMVLSYDLLIKLWAKINFKFTFEWFIVRLASRGSRYPVSQRLNTKRILDETEWINYTDT